MIFARCDFVNVLRASHRDHSYHFVVAVWRAKRQNATRVEWFIFWLIINAVVGFLIGQQKNDVATAIVLSILLGPIGWLIAALSSGNLPKCPHCAEFVKPEATVCRHCGKDLPEMIRQIPEAPAPEPPMPKASKGEKIALAAVLSVIVIASMAVVLY